MISCQKFKYHVIHVMSAYIYIDIDILDLGLIQIYSYIERTRKKEDQNLREYWKGNEEKLREKSV